MRINRPLPRALTLGTLVVIGGLCARALQAFVVLPQFEVEPYNALPMSGPLVTFPPVVAGASVLPIEAEYHGYVGLLSFKLDQDGNRHWVSELPPVLFKETRTVIARELDNSPVTTDDGFDYETKEVTVAVPGESEDLGAVKDGEHVVVRAEYEQATAQYSTIKATVPGAQSIVAEQFRCDSEDTAQCPARFTDAQGNPIPNPSLGPSVTHVVIDPNDHTAQKFLAVFTFDPDVGLPSFEAEPEACPSDYQPDPPDPPEPPDPENAIKCPIQSVLVDGGGRETEHASIGSIHYKVDFIETKPAEDRFECSPDFETDPNNTPDNPLDDRPRPPDCRVFVGQCASPDYDPDTGEYFDDATIRELDGYTFDDPQHRFETCDSGFIFKALAPLKGVEIDSGARYMNFPKRDAQGHIIFVDAAGMVFDDPPGENDEAYVLDATWGCPADADGNYPPCEVPHQLPGATTDWLGHYAMPYKLTPGNFFETNVYAILRYNGIDPRIKRGGIYSERRIAPSGASGSLMDSSGIPLAGTNPQRTVNFGITAAQLVGTAQLTNPDRSNPDLGGTLGGVPLGGDQPPEEAGDPVQPGEVLGDLHVNDDTNITVYNYAKPPFPTASTSSAPTAVGMMPDPLNPNNLIPDRFDRGLVRGIARQDLIDTDLYVYTVDGQPIFERKGLFQQETHGFVCDQAWVEEGGEGAEAGDCGLPFSRRNDVARFNFQTNIPLRIVSDSYKIYLVNRATGYVGSATVALDTIEGDPVLMGFNTGGLPLLRVTTDDSQLNVAGDFPRIDTNGEPLESASCDDDDPLDGLVCMRPPNLEVKVERLRADQVNDGDAFTVGFEGSAMGGDNASTRDQWVRISTTWKDWDGSNLPATLPGFTGRIAKVADEHGTLVSAGGSQNALAQFDITPGTATEVLRLPDDADLSTSHFYVHISGRTNVEADQFVNFGRLCAGAWPTSLNPCLVIPCRADQIPDPEADPPVICQVLETCVTGENKPCLCRSGQNPSLERCVYRSCQPGEESEAGNPCSTGFETLGDETLLGTRPMLYVPIKVPMYNPAASLAQATAQGLGAEPVYDYVYRPEMQFSVWDLEQLDLQHETDDPNVNGSVDLLDPETDVSDLQGLTFVDLLYSLVQNDPNLFDALQQFGQGRELVLAFGEFEIRLVLNTDGSIEALDPGYIPFLSPEDFLTLRLYQSTDEGNVLWEFDEEASGSSIDIILADGKTIVHPNEEVQALAITEPPGMQVSWSKVDVKGTARFQINASTGLITAPEECGEGHIKLRAQKSDNANVFREEWVRVGCECETCNTPGNGDLAASSIDAQISLGKSDEGGVGGTLFLHAEEPAAVLSTPRPLEFSSMVEGVEVIRKDGALRQIIAPESFADIVTLDEFAYELRIYPLEARGTLTDGIYSIEPIDPLSTWRIENPSGSATDINELLLTETKAGRVKTSRFTFNPTNGDWTLDRGDGLSLETVSTTTDAGDRIETRTIKNDSNIIASVTRQRFHEYPWGDEVIEEVTDPNGAALTTTTTFYDDINAIGSYSKVKSIQRPDASWTRFTYTGQGGVANTASAYLDFPITSLDSQVRVTQNDYAPVDTLDIPDEHNRTRPRTVTELIAGQPVSRTYYAFIHNAQNEPVEIVERAATPGAPYGSPQNLRTQTTLIPPRTSILTPHQPGEGQPKETLEPDATLTRYTYEPGTYANATFTPSTGGLAQRTTATQGTVTSPQGLSHKTTQTLSITDVLGNAVREETRVYTGSSYELLSWKETEFQDGRAVATRSSNGATTEAEWGCCTQDSTTDEMGVTTTFTFDDVGRTATEERSGITTTFSYDGAGRQVGATRSAGALALGSSQAFDLAGRNISRTDEQGRSTSTIYAGGGRVTTVTRPGGATEVSGRFVDGRVKSMTGTGVTSRFFTYGVNPDGSQWTQVNTGSATSPMFERTTVDFLGRTISIERPTFDGGTATSESFYNDKGQLVRTTEPGRADTVFEYDELGQQVRSGLDVNNNGQLDLASMDRITQTESAFNFDAGAWWQQSTQSVYATDNGDTPTEVVLSQTRMSGFSGDLRSETRTTDVNGNVTVSRTEVDATAARQTTSTQFPDSNIAETTVTEDGRLTSRTSRTGVTNTFGYDALGRQTTSVDPRTGATGTHYNAQGLVDFVEDPAGNRMTFVYEADTGRVSVELNALNKATRKAYDLRGNVVRIWGDVPYPEERVYDVYGRMTELYTFRSGDFSGTDWPIGAQGDRTLWTYQEATGLLISKTDAANEAVTYSYDDAGQLATRTWARGIVTTYERDASTGDLLQVDYADATPDVTYSYDRLGRPETVDDAVGSRTFAYGASLQLESETIDGGTGEFASYDHVLTRNYATSGVVGRETGFTLDSGYQIRYGYNAAGRIDNVSWTIGSVQDAATYTYAAASDLLSGYTTTSGQTTSYQYEAERNLKTRVQNAFSGATVSQYDYTHDPLGRRATEVNSGSAFAAGEHLTYGYNNRNEVTGAQKYQGTNPTDLSQPVADSVRAYTYDPIGNRIAVTEGTSNQVYTANSLNQYAEVDIDSEPKTFVYDEDGNSTAITVDGQTTGQVYNGENRLIRIEPETPMEGDVRLSFVYDYLGRRVDKKIEAYSSGAWQAAATRRFVYDGWKLIAEANGATTTHYAWGLDLRGSLEQAGGTAGLVAAVPNGATASMLYAYDVLGNVSAIYDVATSQATAQYTYDPFGQLASQQGAYADANAFRFSTQYFDNEADLSAYIFRSYDAALGRWGQRDPVNENGGVNLYGLVGNSPVNRWDFLGLFIELWYGNHPVDPEATGENFSHSKLWLMTDQKDLVRTSRHRFLPAKSKTRPDPNERNRGACMWFVAMGAGGDVAGLTGDLFAEFNRDKDRSEDLRNPWLVTAFQNIGAAEAFLDAVAERNRVMNFNFDDTTLEYEAFPGSSYEDWLAWDEFNSNGYVSGLLRSFGLVPPEPGAWAPGYTKYVPSFVFSMQFHSTEELKEEWRRHFPGL